MDIMNTNDFELVNECSCSGQLIKKDNAFFKAEMNTSSLFSYLIAQTGAKVSFWQSDIFIDLKSLDDKINENNPQNFSTVIGLRECGTDCDNMVIQRGFDSEDYIELFFINFYADYDNETCKIELRRKRIDENKSLMAIVKNLKKEDKDLKKISDAINEL